MIGLITGFGTRAGHLVYTKFLESIIATSDRDWPEIMVINVAPNFDKYAEVTPDVISKLKSTVAMMQNCTEIYVACNTVHLYKDQWFADNCVDWTSAFNETIPDNFVRYGSKTSAQGGLYSVEDSERVSDLIECYIGSNTDERTARAKSIWDQLQSKEKRIALCCTELSLAYTEFGCKEDVEIIDCSEFLVKTMLESVQRKQT